MTIEPGKKPCASYRRPGGHLMKERWWYNAVLEGLAKVTDKSGNTKAIALVNWHAFVGNEVMHYVSPLLDISVLPYEQHLKDKSYQKASHEVRCSLTS
jgi:hypothetical protein